MEDSGESGCSWRTIFTSLQRQSSCGREMVLQPLPIGLGYDRSNAQRTCATAHSHFSRQWGEWELRSMLLVARLGPVLDPGSPNFDHSLANLARAVPARRRRSPRARSASPSGARVAKPKPLISGSGDAALRSHRGALHAPAGDGRRPCPMACRVDPVLRGRKPNDDGASQMAQMAWNGR